MVAAVIVGILVGIVGVVPLKIATKKIRTIDPSHSLSLLGPFLITIVLSLVILILGMIVCKLVAPAYAIGYSIAEILAFVIAVIVFGVFSSKRR